MINIAILNISSPKYILETSANEECSPHPFGLKDRNS